jgi:hypothetical protein
MVKLIQIDRLGPRIEGMLYKRAFEETWSLLDEVSSAQYFISVVVHSRHRVPENCLMLVNLLCKPSRSRSSLV